MNEKDLHLAKAMVDLELDGKRPKKTAVSRMHDKQHTFRRTRSLNAPSPIQQFGPCGRIMKNSAMVMTIQDPASQRLTWYKPPLSVLVIKKVRDLSVLPPFVQLVTWLIEEKRMVVFVEASVLEDPALVRDPRFQAVRDRLQTFRDGTDDLQDRIDFIVCLGGDGTLLYASLLFQQSVPPVMAFHLGSLGFLTPFEFDNFQEQVTNVLEGRPDTSVEIRNVQILSQETPEIENLCELDDESNNSYFYCSDDGNRCQRQSCVEKVENSLEDWRKVVEQSDGRDYSVTKIDRCSFCSDRKQSRNDSREPATTGDNNHLEDKSLREENAGEYPVFFQPYGADVKPGTSVVPDDNYQKLIRAVTTKCSHAALTLRSRLRCIIMRKGEEGQPAKPPTNLLVLNEVVVDRGPSPYLSNIDLFMDGKRVTSVQGDGLIVSTPTGSTAYAVAAGASMIHPSVPAIMVTPICPHSLSFRPIVVPAGVELKIMANSEARSTAYVSFDGRNQQELRVGDSLRVTTSIYPVPSICAADQITDWFESLAECLHWNVRKRQKHLDELSDLTHSSSNDTLDSLDRDS